MQKGRGAYRCPRCGTLTSGQQHFCPKCGEPLTIKCRECGETWRYLYEYLFCPSCGAKAPTRKF